MTREEAIKILKAIRVYECYPKSASEETKEALDMAIEALQAEPTKAVSPSLADVYKWERDIALSQLEEYGIGFAEKKRDDLVEVVRCKDCIYYETCNLSSSHWWKGGYTVDIEFCSFGERRAP
jgi:hypothetical protein